jgi:hypothetical protein
MWLGLPINRETTKDITDSFVKTHHVFPSGIDGHTLLQ